MEKPKIKISYWNNRGYIYVIQLALEYVGEKYDFTPAICGPPPTFHKKEWRSKKYELLKGFDFPNLPYYQDGDVKLTHTMTILRYICRKHGLFPITDQQILDADLVCEELQDQMDRSMWLCYNHSLTEEGKVEFWKQSIEKLEELSQKIKKTPGVWLIGDKLMYVDFYMYHIMDHWRILFPTILDGFPIIQEFIKCFENLDNIKAFLNSERYRKFPLWSERAKYGASQELCFASFVPPS